MPASPNRLRHGMGHPRLPSDATGPGTGVSSRTPTGTVSGSAPVKQQVIPVSVMDAFYQMLPSPNLQQISENISNRFSANDLNEGLVIGSIKTRPQQVYIYTNISFYALIPGSGLNSPSVTLTEHQLSGLVRFDLTIDNTSPMNLVAQAESPYNDPLFPRGSKLSGWQTLNNDFGSTRYGSAFALYARSQQVMSITMRAVQRNRFPRFVIDRVGFEMHGYVSSEGDFDEMWRRTVRTK